MAKRPPSVSPVVLANIGDMLVMRKISKEYREIDVRRQFQDFSNKNFRTADPQGLFYPLSKY